MCICVFCVFLVLVFVGFFRVVVWVVLGLSDYGCCVFGSGWFKMIVCFFYYVVR